MALKLQIEGIKMKRLIKALLISSSIFVISSQALASCPDPKEVTFGCTETPSGNHCQWSAPWYEGYQDATAKIGEKVTFEKALWNSRSKTKTDLGSTVCFYITSRGNEIHLSQNDWGGVPFPGNNWYYGEAGDYQGWLCDAHSTSTCHFLYPY